jgi:hypothetical protein
MAETTPPNPPDAVPPKPPEAAKVQPKKETVRINLPPKPTASTTVKIPAPAAPTPARAVAAPAVAANPAQAPVAATPAARQAGGGAPVSRGAPVVRGPVVQAVSGLDTGLAVAAGVISILVVVILFTL